MSNEQTHPLHATDKSIIDALIVNEKPDDLDFINIIFYFKFTREISIAIY